MNRRSSGCKPCAIQPMAFKLRTPNLKMRRARAIFFWCAPARTACLKIANMVTDLEELKQAQQAAREILKADPSLQKAEHKGLRDAVDQLFQTVGETGLN